MCATLTVGVSATLVYYLMKERCSTRCHSIFVLVLSLVSGIHFIDIAKIDLFKRNYLNQDRDTAPLLELGGLKKNYKHTFHLEYKFKKKLLLSRTKNFNS